ncbi:MAG: hypothetical protein WAJ86_06000, partial [Candidatus Acidiferrales bacterium]
MKRRDLFKLAGAGALELGAAKLLRAEQNQMPGMQPNSPSPAETTKADFTLRISPVTVELTPNYIISTVGYNGTSPGPALRMREGVPVTVDAI